MKKTNAINTLYDHIDSLEVGQVQQYKNMEVMPLYSDKKSTLDYLVLEDAMDRKGFNIKETGNVNILDVYNKNNKDVLIIKGEYVVGGKQNRMVSVNGLVGKKKKKKIQLPVHCIEQGRWNTPGNFYAGKVAAAGMRHGLTKDFSGSKGQQQTWAEVSHKLHGTGVESRTANFDDFYKVNQKSIDDYVGNFKSKRGQVGFIVAITNMWGHKEFYMDMFDKPKTMKKHHTRMLESYATEAIENKTVHPRLGALPPDSMIHKDTKSTQRLAMNFLDRIKEGYATTSRSLDKGIDIEISNEPMYEIMLEKARKKFHPNRLTCDDGFVPEGPHNISPNIARYPDPHMFPHNMPKLNGSGLVLDDTIVYFGASEQQTKIHYPHPRPVPPRPPIGPGPVIPYYPMPGIRHSRDIYWNEDLTCDDDDTPK
ncbi:MAG: hypothetical protein KKA79_07450 [Nanoarchaeota archaeon]|nr:hypothetical protein [Nanoarchaeota archaeon]MCG2717449.1 hypothetical protein [Nanoarchaeota archaeon]